MTYVQGTQEENIGVYKECDNIAIVTFSQLKAQNTFTEGDRRNSEHMYDVWHKHVMTMKRQLWQWHVNTNWEVSKR